MGRLGKGKTLWVWAAMVLLAGCAAAADRDGRYAGAVDADGGVCGSAIGGHANGTLLLRGQDAMFAPDDGVMVLRGRVDAAGHVTASATTPGIDHKPFAMVFEGDLRDGRVNGRYATPRCRAVVRLDRVGP